MIGWQVLPLGGGAKHALLLNSHRNEYILWEGKRIELYLVDTECVGMGGGTIPVCFPSYIRPLSCVHTCVCV